MSSGSTDPWEIMAEMSEAEHDEYRESLYAKGERAAIMEYDGGLSREEAERRAGFGYDQE